jgi:hypothetical protein
VIFTGRVMMSSSQNKCSCAASGYCDRHRVFKTEHWHYLCQHREDYRHAWDEARGPGQTASDETRQRKQAEREDYIERMHALWASLHVKTNPTQAWLDNWCAKIPPFGCSCRNWLAEYLVSNPPMFGSTWRQWTVDLHNAVNKKLGKDHWEEP